MPASAVRLGRLHMAESTILRAKEKGPRAEGLFRANGVKLAFGSLINDHCCHTLTRIP